MNGKPCEGCRLLYAWPDGVVACRNCMRLLRPEIKGDLLVEDWQRGLHVGCPGKITDWKDGELMLLLFRLAVIHKKIENIIWEMAQEVPSVRRKWREDFDERWDKWISEHKGDFDKPIFRPFKEE